MWPVDQPPPKKLPRSKLAASFALPETTPDNVVRMVAGALSGNNQAHTIKDSYDENNPPPPLVSATQADRETQDAVPLPSPPHV